MKTKMIMTAVAMMTLLSCTKNTVDEPVFSGDMLPVNISFVSVPNEPTKAFFDPAATTEAWEKSLSSLTIFAFNQAGELIVQRNFNSSELAAKNATFALPRSTAGTTCEFYAVANLTGINVSTKTELQEVVENAAADYNGTFAEVTTKAKRASGFVMSGMISKEVAQAGTTTDIAVALKRTVAKVAVQTTLAPEFTNRYPGKVKINSVKLSKAAVQSPVIEGTSKTGAMTYAHTQTPAMETDKYNALFYIFENSAKAAGQRVLLELDGIYDKDGNYSTTNDQTPVTYSLELNGQNNGTVNRNGYYRIAVALSGLTGQDVTIAVTVADWLTPITQSINLGN